VGLIAGTTGEETSANVVLKSKFASEQELPIEYTLTGPQHSIIYLADQLDDWVAACSQWYSRFLPPFYIVPIGIGAFVLPLNPMLMGISSGRRKRESRMMENA
jgi:hypothetical protein